MLEELCGCFHSRHRFCRMCLEKRRALFTSPKESYPNRNDGEHEGLAFKLAEVDARIVAADVKRFGDNVPGTKRYTKTADDRELEAKCCRVSIDAGDNALYELFYYANCRGIGRGLHGACWPDILHVVLRESDPSDLTKFMIGAYIKKRSLNQRRRERERERERE